MGKHDDYLQTEFPTLMRPGETIMGLGIVVTDLGNAGRMVWYWSAFTTERLIMLSTTASAWSGKLNEEWHNQQSLELSEMTVIELKGTLLGRAVLGKVKVARIGFQDPSKNLKFFVPGKRKGVDSQPAFQQLFETLQVKVAEGAFRSANGPAMVGQFQSPAGQQFGGPHLPSQSGPQSVTLPKEKWKWHYSGAFGIMYGPIPIGIILFIGGFIAYAAMK